MRSQPLGLPIEVDAAVLRTIGCIGAVAVLWAAIEMLGYSIAHRYPFEQIVAMRYAVHLAVLAAVCVPRVGWRRLTYTRRPFLQLARGLCMFVMPASFIFVAAGLGSTAIWSMFWIAPVIVPVLAAWRLGEKVPPIIWLATVVGCIGAFCLYGRVPVLGPAAAGPLLGAFSFALYVVLSRELRSEHIEASLFYTGLAAFVGMLPFALATWQPLHIEDLWRIAAVGVVGLLLLQRLDLALEYSQASLVAPLLYGAVVCEIAVRVLLSGTWPSLAASSGALLVAIAILTSLSTGVTRESH